MSTLRRAPTAILGLLIVAGLVGFWFGACRATDAAPDEFSVQVGTSDSEGSHTSSAGPLGSGRSSATAGGDAQWIALGWTWHLGDVADREERRATDERLARLLEREAVTIIPPRIPTDDSARAQVAPTTELASEPSAAAMKVSWRDAWVGVPALLFALARYLMKPKEQVA